MVALSTLEAEFVAASEATRESIFLYKLTRDVNITDNQVRQQEAESSWKWQVPIRIDNHGALKFINSGVIRSRTKHIDIKFHHAHDEQAKGHVVFEYVGTKENLADIFTKGLPQAQHEFLLDAMVLRLRRNKTLRRIGKLDAD